MILADLQTGTRALFRRPGLAAAAILTLTLAVAAVALVLAFHHATQVAPVAFPRAERLVDVLAGRRGTDAHSALYTADFRELQGNATTFSSLAAYEPLGRAALTGAGEPRQVVAHRVSAGFFATLGVPLVAGRDFAVSDEEDGAPAVVLLSTPLARQLFGDDGGVQRAVGRDVELDGRPYEVVGVVAGGFGLRGGVPDLWLPLPRRPALEARRESATVGAIGRLAPGASLAAARDEADAIAGRFTASLPTRQRDRTFHLRPLTEVMTAGLRPSVRLLFAAAALLVLLAVVNGAGLLLARGSERRREMAVRASLGAGRGRLARLVLSEALLLAVAGVALGTTAAALALPLLPDLHGRLLYRSVDLALAGPVLAGAAAAGLAVALLAALPAALVAAAAHPVTGLVAPRGAGPSRRGRRVGALLVAVQVALSCVLVAGSGALLASLGRLGDADFGFRTAGVAAFEVTPPPSRYPGAAELAAFQSRLAAELAALPGVEAAALANDPPGSGWGSRLWRAGAAAGADAGAGGGDEGLGVRFLLVSPDFFAAAGIPLRAGRPFTAADRAGAEPVVVLSESAAHRLAAGTAAQDGPLPLGDLVAFDERGDRRRVVGVVGDTRASPYAEVEPAVYLPYAQSADLLDAVGVRTRLVLLRTALPPSALAAAVRARVAALDPALPVAGFGGLAERTAAFAFQPRLQAVAGSTFAAVAVALSAAGIYGLLAFSVARRRREIGIRMALGADRRRLLSWVLGQGVAPAAVGAAAGLPAVWLVGRALQGLLYGVSAADPGRLAATVALLLAVAALAALAPARRACRVEPGEALRAGLP